MELHYNTNTDHFSYYARTIIFCVKNICTDSRAYNGWIYLAF